MLQKVIDYSVKPCLILAGILTCGLGVLLLSPQAMMTQLFHLPYQQDYSIIIQHWSFIITLVGIAMIIAAFIPHLRVPILLFALIEKLGLIILGLLHIHSPGTQGFIPAITIDSIISLYLILYFIHYGVTWNK